MRRCVDRMLMCCNMTMMQRGGAIKRKAENELVRETRSVPVEEPVVAQKAAAEPVVTDSNDPSSQLRNALMQFET